MDPSNQTSDIRSFVHLSISHYVYQMKVSEKWERISKADHCEWFTIVVEKVFLCEALFLEHEEKMSETDCVYKIYDRVDEYINGDGFMYIVTYGRMFWNEIKREILLPHVVAIRMLSNSAFIHLNRKRHKTTISTWIHDWMVPIDDAVVEFRHKVQWLWMWSRC